MNQAAIAVGFILFAGGIAGHFNSHPKDWPILVSAIKQGLSNINQWFMTNDKEVVYPVALIIGFSLACIASWVLS